MNKLQLSRDFTRRALQEPDAFWAEEARGIYWHAPFRQTCDFSQPPFVKWFVGGTTNLCYNAVDRHLGARAGQAALSFYSTEVQQEASFTYRDLHREVQTFAAALRALGIGRGDRV